MSLLRLLSAGRSLVGMRDTTSRYQMRSGSKLPKFGSSKNPFASPAKVEPELPKAELPAPAPAMKAEPVKMETDSLFEAKPIVTPAPVEVKQPLLEPVRPALIEPKPASPVVVPVAAPAAKAKERAPFGEWVKKINPLSYLPTRTPGSKSGAKPKPVRAAVQGELSLEKVKVVRNDLSDADFEVVPARQPKKPRAVEVAAPVVAPEEKAGPTTWNRLTSGLIGAGQNLMH